MACARRVVLTALTLLLAAAAGVIAITSPPSASVSYTLSFLDPGQHAIEVEARFPPREGALELRMSRASPGRYAQHDFVSHVSQVAAYGPGNEVLPIAQPAPHAWSVAADGTPVRLRYRVSGNRLDGTWLAVDATHAHINIPASLIWAQGWELAPVSVRIQPPPGRSWRVATQLVATADPFVFTAPNLHYLVDSPIEVSDHTRRTFEADLPHAAEAHRAPTIALALHHAGSDADADRHVEGLRRIVREQAAIFGEYPPFDDGTYTFIADYLPWALVDGMEHRNSSILTSGHSIGSGHQSLLALAAHEFFHVWNVERIRPRSLEPFDLLDVNPSGELWMAEGFTSYYEWLTMARTGLWTRASALESLSRAVSRLVTTPADERRSALDTSLLASLYDGALPGSGVDPKAFRVSHYMHGAALALGFDFALRERTGGDRSLDDFMRAMWHRHGREPGSHPGLVGRPYTLDDIRDVLGEVSRDEAFAKDLLERYVQGREVMDYARLLSLAGLRLRPVARLSADAPPHSGAAPAAGARQNGESSRTAAAVVAPADPVPQEIVPVESAGGDLTDAEAAFRESWLRPRFTRD